MLPYFLGIGAQKSGTTWLCYNLSLHPEIYVPPIKELHYFDRSTKYPSPGLRDVGVIGRVRRKMEYVHEFLRGEMTDLKKWHYKYNCGKYDDRWYESLFSYAQKGMKCGEVTPAYSMLEREDIEKVYNLIPKAKIILIMRNPVDRAWSQFKLVASHAKRNLEEYTEQEIIDFIGSKSSLLRGNYIRTIDNWQSVFPIEQIFLGFFDEIIGDPVGLMRRVFEFLDCSVTDEVIRRVHKEKVFASQEGGMSPRVREDLVRIYRPIIKEMSDRYNSYPSVWLKEMH